MHRIHGGSFDLNRYLINLNNLFKLNNFQWDMAFTFVRCFSFKLVVHLDIFSILGAPAQDCHTTRILTSVT